MQTVIDRNDDFKNKIVQEMEKRNKELADLKQDYKSS